MAQQQARRTLERFVLRLPDGLRNRLKELATQNRRSMNSEILVCLEKAVGSAEEELRHGQA